MLGSPDSYCMIAEDGDNIIGFAMGRFETFYDLTAYNLVEIIVASKYQKSGIGTKMMAELEERVEEMGAAMVQLWLSLFPLMTRCTNISTASSDMATQPI